MVGMTHIDRPDGLVVGTTPRHVSWQVIEFCQSIEPGVEPRYLPIDDCAWGPPGYCFDNLAIQIETQGGSIQYGWLIWESPHIIEAEFHGVWCLDNSWCDITKTVDGEERVLFLPSNKMVFDGRNVRNIRKALDYLGMVIKQQADAGDKERVCIYGTPRNGPCPCGSRLKFKRCHGKDAPKHAGAALRRIKLLGRL